MLFDYGHTLVDFQRAEAAMVGAYRQIRTRLIELAHEEVPEAEELARQITGALEVVVGRSYREGRLQELDLVELLVAAFAGIGIPVDQDLARELAVVDHRAFSESITVSKETRTVLEELSGRYALGLVSNVTLLPELMKADLETLGIAPYFGAIAFSSELGYRKPDPRIFRWVLERLGASPERAVFVGDRLRDDIQGARSLGMRTVLTREFRDELGGPARKEALGLKGADERLRPDFAIRSIRELPGVLEALWARARGEPPAQRTVPRSR